MAVAAGPVAVQRRLGARVARIENLEDVELAAAGYPARAFRFAVLEGAGDGGVEDPSGRHVLVPAGFARVGHREFGEE